MKLLLHHSLYHTTPCLHDSCITITPYCITLYFYTALSSLLHNASHRMRYAYSTTLCSIYFSDQMLLASLYYCITCISTLLCITTLPHHYTPCITVLLASLLLQQHAHQHATCTITLTTLHVASFAHQITAQITSTCAALVSTTFKSCITIPPQRITVPWTTRHHASHAWPCLHISCPNKQSELSLSAYHVHDQ